MGTLGAIATGEKKKREEPKEGSKGDDDIGADGQLRHAPCVAWSFGLRRDTTGFFFGGRRREEEHGDME
jgi:hypothetical protein